MSREGSEGMIRRTIEDESKGAAAAVVDNATGGGKERVVDGGGEVDLINFAAVQSLCVLLQGVCVSHRTQSMARHSAHRIAPGPQLAASSDQRTRVGPSSYTGNTAFTGDLLG